MDTKHVVIKIDDAKKYLSEKEFNELAIFINKIVMGRISDNKRGDSSYYICNIDEPYSKDVLKVIMDGESEKRK